ncbi:MAG: hypothetical protein ACI4J0_05005 [Huintestinicola sp.]|uniref:hypothetical protein n=1 Tax=Huintestinicola sp. TaxID=2981661 RepID=UPI003F05D437
MNDYTVTVGGINFDGRDIASIRLIRQSENMPVKGIVSSELIMTLRTAESFYPNAAVCLSVSGAADMSFCPHFISSIKRRGGLVTIRAFDRMRMTENDFRDGSYKEADEPFVTSQVLGDIASQCGFKPCSMSFSGVPRLYYKDIHGKKIREILNHLSENGVGVWYCSDDEELKFTPFLSASGSVGVDREKSAPLYIHSEKGPFTAVYAKNTATGQVFSAGSGSDFRNMLKLSGKLFDDERTGSAMTLAAQKVWRSFYCAHAHISAAPCGLTEFIFGDIFGLVSVRTEVCFGAGMVFAKAETADICEDESDYTDLLGYELRRRIEADRKYGSTVLTEKGVGFTGDTGTDLGEADISFFSAVGDRVTEFDGAMMDGVMPDSITAVSDTVTRFVYGNTAYTLSYDEGEDGAKSNIRLTKEESN